MPLASATRLPERPALARPMFRLPRVSLQALARSLAQGLQPAAAALVAGAPGGDAAVHPMLLALEQLVEPAASSACWASIFSAQSSKAAKPWSRRLHLAVLQPEAALGDPFQEGAVVADDQGGGAAAAISASSASMARMSRWLVGSSSRMTSGSSAKARGQRRAAGLAARQALRPLGRVEAERLQGRLGAIGSAPAGGGVVQHRRADDLRLLRDEGDAVPAA